MHHSQAWRSRAKQSSQLTRSWPFCCSIACHPSKAEVACGFKSGALRIFDASSAALVQESRQHTGAVTQLAFARHGRELLSLGEDAVSRSRLVSQTCCLPKNQESACHCSQCFFCTLCLFLS